MSAFIDEHRARIGVQPICDVLGVSASAYYHRATPERSASLVAAGMQLQQVGGHLERIAQVLRVHPEESLSDRRPAPRLAGHIQFEGVSFRYDASAPWAVRDLSVEIQPGQKVAIVGRTSSGKSTVAKLLRGLYEPTRGRVLFDGTAMDDLDLRTVRIQCGVVMQEPTVFNTTVGRNIAYNDPSLPMSAIVQAARLADLHGDIERMPMGYETMVAEGGSALSGGQRQRLAIARALVREPRILVLDEATRISTARPRRRSPRTWSPRGPARP